MSLTAAWSEAFNASNNKASLEEFRESKRYYHGNQLPEDVKADLRERGQPAFVENIYKKHSNKILGFNDSGRQEIKAQGRQREDKNIASLITDVCKTVTDKPEYQLNKKQADEDLQHGLGVLEVYVEASEELDLFGHKEKDIKIVHVPSKCFLIDCYSQKPDASDAKIFHELFWIDREDAVIALESRGLPSDVLPVVSTRNITRERLLLTRTWVRQYSMTAKKFVWRQVYWHTNNIVYEDPREYNDHPYAVRKLYIDDETNQWYGLFRDTKPIQDSVNFSTNRMLNMLGSVKILYEKGAVEDPETFADDYSQDNSVTPVNDGALSGNRVKEIKHTTEIQQLGSIIAGQKKTADDTAGLNDEMLATAVNRMSGEGIRERVKLGMVSINNFITASDQMDVVAFSKAIKMMQEYFTAEQVFKIVEKDEAERYFTINEIEKNEDGSVVYDESAKPKRKNKLTIGRYDIKVTTTAATEGASSERYRNGVEMLKVLQQTRPDLVPHVMPLILRENDSPIAQDIMEIVKKMDEQQAQNPQMQKDAELTSALKEIQKTNLELKNMLMEREGALMQAKTIKLVADAGAKSAKAELDKKELGQEIMVAQNI